MLKKLTLLTTAVLLSTTVTDVQARNTSASADASLIESLPKTGSVTLSGVVDSVINENKFILRDSGDKTIDINTSAAASVKEGDTITVSGNLSSEAFGMGKEIVDAKVSQAGFGAVAPSAGTNRDAIDPKDLSDDDNAGEDNREY